MGLQNSFSIIVFMLILHVLIAFLGLVGSILALFKPVKSLFIINYGLIAATLLSGTYLVVVTHSNILHACISGLLYLAVTNILLIFASRRIRQII